MKTLVRLALAAASAFLLASAAPAFAGPDCGNCENCPKKSQKAASAAAAEGEKKPATGEEKPKCQCLEGKDCACGKGACKCAEAKPKAA
jgi:hypothetical protein